MIDQKFLESLGVTDESAVQKITETYTADIQAEQDAAAATKTQLSKMKPSWQRAFWQGCWAPKTKGGCPMKVTCTGRRVTLKPSFIENAEKRLAKLDKFFPDEAQAQVTVTVEKSGQTVEIMLRSKDLAMRAEKTDERMEDALADAVDLLTRRVVKYRKRLGTKLTAAAAEIPATEPEESMDIVREKHFALKPCSTEEAILQMDLLGQSFFLYHSTENDKIQVVYRRADGGYGVLIPEA